MNKSHKPAEPACLSHDKRPDIGASPVSGKTREKKDMKTSSPARADIGHPAIIPPVQGLV
jgi:hypothetical protein